MAVRHPRITVITAVRNEARYVRAAVMSVLNQSCRDFEYIIVDDASTDATPDVLDEFDDPRLIRIRLETCRGSAEARNVALRRARGEYVAVQDGDDVSYPERLSREAEFLDENEDVALVGCGIVIVDDDGHVIRTRAPAVLQRNVGLCHGSIMFRRRCLDEVGLYRPSLVRSQDRDLMARIAQRHESAKIPDVLCAYRLVAAKRTVRAVLRQCRYDLLVDEINRDDARAADPASLAALEAAMLRPGMLSREWWRGRAYMARWCRFYGELVLARGRYAFAARHYVAALLLAPPRFARGRRALARLLLALRRGNGTVPRRNST